MPNLTNIAKRIRNIMRKDSGCSGAQETIRQLSWMFFLKIYDELKESNEYELEKGYKSIIPEKYRWRNWAYKKYDDKGRETSDTLTGDELLNFIDNELFPTLKNLRVDESVDPRSAIVPKVFARLSNCMENGTLIRDVLDEVNSINFDDLEDRHVFNEIYETILKDLQYAAGDAGEFYTPRVLTDFVVEMINPKPGEKIADFACGTGGFLVSAIKHLKLINTQKALDSIKNNIIGQEFKPDPYLFCVTNMLLNGTDGTNIIKGSSLNKNVYDFTNDEKVDVVLMNPPFGGEVGPGEDKNFPENLRTSESANLFIALILYRLKQNGRVGVVLPNGFLTTNDQDAFVNLKTKLLNECNLHTIVRLPKGLFYAPIETNVLFFDKTKKTEGIWYYSLPLPNDYKSFSKTKPFESCHLDDCRKWWNERKIETNTNLSETNNIYLDKNFKNAYYVGLDQIVKNNYNLDFKNPNIKDEAETLSLDQLLEEFNKQIKSINENSDVLNELLKGK